MVGRRRTSWGLAVALGSVAAAGHGAAVQVDLEQTRLVSDGKRTALEVGLAGDRPGPLPVTVLVEVLDPSDRAVARVEHRTAVTAEPAVVRCPLTGLDRLSDEVRVRLPWYRLRLVVTAEDGSPPFDVVTSVAALAPTAPALTLWGPHFATAVSRLPLWVSARHPLTREPLAGLPVLVRVYDEGGDTVAEVPVLTAGDGTVQLEAELSERLEDELLEVEVEARRGPFLDRQAVEVWLELEPRIALVTDRPLYRPGQTVHARAVVLKPSGPALANAPVTFSLRDEHHDEVLRRRTHTSAFGVAHADWPIPADAERGKYELEVELDEQADWAAAETELTVADYELPTFRLKAAPEQPFYLPGIPAALEVTVETLAGAPLADVPVEVAEVPSWFRWWDPDDAPAGDEVLWRGVTDRDGRCRAPVDLEPTFRSTLGSGKFDRRFADLTLLVSATDPESRRTTSRRVAVRASREPIHVYLREGVVVPGRGVTAFVSTLTADGRPTPCTVTLSDKGGAAVATVRTGELGLVRVELPVPAKSSRFGLTLEAVDADGRRGNADLPVWLWNQVEVHARPHRFFLDPGEPVRLEVVSAGDQVPVVVEARSGGETTFWSELRTRAGRASIEVPYDERFRGEVEISAMPAPASGSDPYDGDGTFLIVLYPGQRRPSLTLDAKPVEGRPGDRVALRARVEDPGGEPLHAAVGLAVVDTASEALALESGEVDAVSHFRRGTEVAVEERWRETYAGLSRSDLAFLAGSPVTSELEAAAELLLSTSDSRPRSVTETEAMVDELYGDRCKATLEPLLVAVRSWSETMGHRPGSRQELDAAFATAAVELTALLDPWGRPFLLALSPRERNLVLGAASLGSDGVAGTIDDLDLELGHWPWLEKVGQALEPSLEAGFAEDCSWATSADQCTSLLAERGLVWETLADPWGHPLELEVRVHGAEVRLRVLSPGPDGVLTTSGYTTEGDDVVAWTEAVDTFAGPGARIAQVLLDRVAAGDPFPVEEAAVERLRDVVSPEDLLDPLGRPYRLAVDSTWEYQDRVNVVISGSSRRTDVTPEAVQVWYLEVWSTGPDEVAGSADDVRVGRLRGPTFATAAEVQRVAERPSTGGREATLSADQLVAPLLAGCAGSVIGVVRDDDHQAVPGVIVVAAATGGRLAESAVTDAAGRFALVLPPGSYTLRCSLPGFLSVEVTISVQVGEATRVAVTMVMATFTEEMVVASDALPVETTATSTGLTVGDELGTRGDRYRGADDRTAAPRPLATPRLRTDFPETLLWVPEAVTDGEGRVTFDLQLADSVTTWRVQAVANTADGQLATGEVEVVASLPFYADLELPPILTSGDRLAVPVVVRNFTDVEQEVTVTLEAATPGLEVQPPGRAVARPAAGRAERVSLPLTAGSPTTAARLRATTASGEVADAIERTARVEPLGRLERRAASTLLRGEVELDLEIPADALGGTVAARVEVLPDITAQLQQAVAGIQRRPLGCGEQITSAGWLALLLLEHLPASDHGAELAMHAERTVSAAVARLVALAHADGGFAFWPGGEPDQVLTAHVLRFLASAANELKLDPGMAVRAARWLALQQAGDGSFPTSRHWMSLGDVTIQDTAFVTRALAEINRLEPEVGSFTTSALERGLAFLAPRVAALDEPHALASYALASRAAGRTDEAEAATRRLSSLARTERGAPYWQARFNTPLAGWGRPGRVETTALAVLALARSADPDLLEMAGDGAVELLRQRDGDGVWGSTPATLAALEALSAVDLGGGGGGGEVGVWVGGNLVTTLPLESGSRPGPPRGVDLSACVRPGANRVRLVRHDQQGAAVVTVSGRWHRPWGETPSTEASADGLHLALACDRTEAAVGETVTCTAHAGRMEERGRGMLLLEFGLPPGVEVDHHALERSLGWRRFEVAPDRVVVYLWPLAGGQDLEVRFSPRLAEEVFSSPSRLSEYYNPEAEVALAPSRFRFTEPNP